MKIKLNERAYETEEGTTLFGLRDIVKPEADIAIRNGAPAAADAPLSDGDSVVFIKRGEAPTEEEMEALIAARHTPGVHEVVKNATVGIAGCGGLGSAVAIALARIGTGKLIVADFDVVEPSNLNRQQFFVDQIGLPKVEALRAVLARVNPYVAVETHDVKLDAANIPTIFGGTDVMVEAFDNPAAKAMLFESFASKFPEKPLVMATGLAGHYPSNAVRTQRISDNVYVVGDLVKAAGPGTGLMAPRVGVAAHHQANAVLRALLGEDVVGE